MKPYSVFLFQEGAKYLDDLVALWVREFLHLAKPSPPALFTVSGQLLFEN